MSDLRPPLGPAFDAFGVPATVTPAGGVPIATTIVWVQGPGAELPLAGETTRDGRWRCRLRRDQVATLAPGSTISAAPPGSGTAQTFRVDHAEPLADVLEAVVA
jgi:hypothetical protein